MCFLLNFSDVWDWIHRNLEPCADSSISQNDMWALLKEAVPNVRDDDKGFVIKTIHEVLHEWKVTIKTYRRMKKLIGVKIKVGNVRHRNG